ncbi:nibrin [Leptopilina boulardi]|uniref:nibrin n=1 Tax=Leptopilina boulardi TaxID=63433 RepID=UPI0021F67F21|nr:nibrin [Leptopilina boulardi]
MWFLKGPKGEIIYLKRNSSINVGRIQGDIVLRDDKSISRNHASVSVEPKNYKNKSLCFVKDIGSKYGSTIMRGSETIKITKEGIEVHHKDKIKFGLQNNDYVAFYIPTVVLVSSMNDTKYLQSLINELDGYIVLEWSNDVTHLTTIKAKLGEKIATALVNCVPIVGIEYWEAVKLAVKNNQDLPKFSDYILPISEDIIDNTKVSLSPNIIRKSLFSGSSFLFFSYSQLNIYKKIINDAGGKTIMFKKSIHSDLKQFCSDNFIVVYYMIGSSQTEESILDTQRTKTAYEEIDELLRKSKRRMISDSEIMLAILHCSLDKYCNTKHNYKELLLKQNINVSKDDRKTIFALDTEELHSKTLESHNNDNIVPESIEITSQDTQWSVIGNPSKIPPSSLGISAISTIKGDSQESTEDIGSELSKLTVDNKRSEKRSSEFISSTPVKRAKFNNASSLFPVVSKKSSQNILNSQDLLISQISKNSQSINRDDSIIVDYVKKSTTSSYSSQSQNKFNQPSTSNNNEKQKVKSTKNIFDNWMEEKPKSNKIEIIEDLDSPKKKTTTIDKRDSSLKENKIPQKIRTHSDSMVNDNFIDDNEPQMKKRRINTNNSSSSSSSLGINSERNDKRKRDTGNDSDSNQFVIEKKQNRDDNEKIFQIEVGDNFNSNDDDCLIVTGLIRQELSDPSLNDTFGQKIFNKAYNKIPRMRITLDSMVSYGIEVE